MKVLDWLVMAGMVVAMLLGAGTVYKAGMKKGEESLRVEWRQADAEEAARKKAEAQEREHRELKATVRACQVGLMALDAQLDKLADDLKALKKKCKCQDKDCGCHGCKDGKCKCGKDCHCKPVTPPAVPCCPKKGGCCIFESTNAK